MAQRLRLADIAARAGVSPATASKFLNGHYAEMSAATRERIAAVVAETGYRPNRTARNLRLERSHTLGVILADIRNPFSSAMLEELSNQTGDAGYALTCAISGNDPAREGLAIERLLDAGVDGLVVNTCGDNDEALLAANARVPVVLLDRALDAPEHAGALDIVTSNNEQLVSDLVDAVAQSGCSRIHLLTEADPHSSVRRERAMQFMRDLGKRDLSGSTLALAPTVREAARRLVELADEHIPLGLIAVNGLVFQQLVEAIARSGLLVPERLRIATFDEYPWNRLLLGGVTTAKQDTHAIACATLRLMTERIEEDPLPRVPSSSCPGPHRHPKRVEVPGEVIRRASTCC